jgi:ribosomal protein L40E
MSALIKNFGTIDIAELLVEYLLYSKTASITLINDYIEIHDVVAGDTRMIEFEWTFTCTAVGEYQLMFRTKLVGDENPINDMQIVNFTVALLDRRPVARIVTPLEGDVFLEGEPIHFNASASFDPDDDLNGNNIIDGTEIDNLTYSWQSSINGIIGYSQLFTIDTLAVGRHKITLYVADGSWNVSTTVNITIHELATFIIRDTFANVEVWYRADDQPGGEILEEEEPPIAPGDLVSIGLFYTIAIEPIHWVCMNISITYGSVASEILSGIEETKLRVWFLERGTWYWRLPTENGIDLESKLVWSKIEKSDLMQLGRAEDSAAGTILGLVGVFGPPKAKEYGNIIGWVKDNFDLPLLNVNVSIDILECWNLTDMEGFYKLDFIPSGTYDIQATKMNYITDVQHDITVKGGQTIIVNFTLTPYQVGGIRGLVQDFYTGERLSNATITVVGTCHKTVTDIDGNYRLSQIAVGHYELSATCTGYRAASKHLSVLPNQYVVADFYLKPINSPPELIDAKVTPRTGDINTIFKFTVIYRDADGDAPDENGVQLRIDVKKHIRMSKIKGISFEEGVTYSKELKLSPGVHKITFYAEDERGATAVGNCTELPLTVEVKALRVGAGLLPTTEQLFSTTFGLMIFIIVVVAIVVSIIFVWRFRIKRKLLRLRREEEEAKARKVDIKMCTGCGTLLPVGATKCTKCGRALRKEEEERGIKCPGCGRLNPEKTLVCTGCGRELYPSKGPAERKELELPEAIETWEREYERKEEKEEKEEVISKKPLVAREREEVPRALKRDINCPACGHLVRAGETACPGCGETDFSMFVS